MNIQSLVQLLIVGLVLLVIWIVIGFFVHGIILTIIGLILVLVFLLYTLRTFGIV